MKMKQATLRLKNEEEDAARGNEEGTKNTAEVRGLVKEREKDIKLHDRKVRPNPADLSRMLEEGKEGGTERDCETEETAMYTGEEQEDEKKKYADRQEMKDERKREMKMKQATLRLSNEEEDAGRGKEEGTKKTAGVRGLVKQMEEDIMLQARKVCPNPPYMVQMMEKRKEGGTERDIETEQTGTYTGEEQGAEEKKYQ